MIHVVESEKLIRSARAQLLSPESRFHIAELPQVISQLLSTLPSPLAMVKMKPSVEPIGAQLRARPAVAGVQRTCGDHAVWDEMWRVWVGCHCSGSSTRVCIFVADLVQ